jgi:type II secretory pathway component GspD/PulD (secretin)
MFSRTSFLCAIAAVLVAGTAPGFTQSPARTNQLYSANFVDVEIVTLAETVATVTGRTIVLHPKVRGLVSLVSERPLTASQMFAAFAQVVAVKGYVVEEVGGVVQIHPGKPLEANISPSIDLNSPGAMDLLRRSNPQDYSRVTQVLEAAAASSCGGRELSAIQARLSVTDLSCGMLLKTSNPPQRVVTFNLGVKRYTKLVTLGGARPTITPLTSEFDKK